MPGTMKYREGGPVRKRGPQPRPRPRASPPPRSPGMTEEEVLKDRSSLHPYVREPMMREGDPRFDFGREGMRDPSNFEGMFDLRERRRTEPTRLKKGGVVKKKAGGVVKKANGGMIGKGCK